MKLHWMQFDTGDWLKDPDLSLCTPATRGVWIDLISRMHESGRVGRLSGTIDQLCRLARCVPAELALALTDLQTTGTADVTERNGVVTVTNRRMEREAKERAGNALRQSKHRSGSSSNKHITPLSHLYDSESESEFLDSLSENLKAPSILEALKLWLTYKAGRGDVYQPIGRKTLFGRASKFVALHGEAAVVDAIERAVANRWQGWDHADAFKAGRNGHPPATAKKVRLPE